MTNRETEEKLRKLASLDPRQADLGWLFFLSGEGQERELADDLIDVLLFQDVGKSYQRNIFLEPPPPSECYGPYALGNIIYPPGRPYCPLGLREDEWIKHVLITGMTGTGKTNLIVNRRPNFTPYRRPILTPLCEV